MIWFDLITLSSHMRYLCVSKQTCFKRGLQSIRKPQVIYGLNYGSISVSLMTTRQQRKSIGDCGHQTKDVSHNLLIHIPQVHQRAAKELNDCHEVNFEFLQNYLYAWWLFGARPDRMEETMRRTGRVRMLRRRRKWLMI